MSNGHFFIAIRWLSLLVLQLAVSTVSLAEQAVQQLTVAEPFIELRSGPGAAYPIFHVVDRGETVELLHNKTGWFKLSTSKGLTGWVSREQIELTLTAQGELFRVAETTEQDYRNRRYELGALAGRFQSAPVLSVYGGWQFTPNLSSEFTWSHSVGTVSSSDLLLFSIAIQPFADWRWSPFFKLGVGDITVEPSATLIRPETRSNTVTQAGWGVQTRIADNFIFRLEYNDYMIFSASNNKDSNEDISEWKAGFSIFF